MLGMSVAGMVTVVARCHFEIDLAEKVSGFIHGFLPAH